MHSLSTAHTPLTPFSVKIFEPTEMKRGFDQTDGVKDESNWTDTLRNKLFKNAYVIPLTRDGRALLSRERRGKEEQLSLLGGAAILSAVEPETVMQCMSCVAKLESGGALSDTLVEQ